MAGRISLIQKAEWYFCKFFYNYFPVFCGSLLFRSMFYFHFIITKEGALFRTEMLLPAVVLYCAKVALWSINWQRDGL